MSVAAKTKDGVVTSWIPLTTVFTPSSGCESVFRLNGPSLVAFDPGYGLDIDTAVKCAPSAVTTWWEQARLGVGGNDHTAISIQPLTCPYLWTTVATFTKDRITTQIMCCPSGYSNLHATSGPVNGDCISKVSKGMILTYASTSDGASEDWSTATTTLSASSSVGAIAVVGYNFARATSTMLSSSSVNPTAASYRTSTSSSSNEQLFPTTTIINSPKHDGLSTGVSAGIGVGASLGVLGIAALILMFVLLRRRGKNRSSDSGEVVPATNFGTANKDLNVSGGEPQTYHDLAHEIQGCPPPSELPSGHKDSPAELDSHGWSM